MKIMNINRVTIFFNFIFIFLLTSYFYIDLDKNKDQSLKLIKDKIIINNITPTVISSNIDLEITELPKITKNFHGDKKVEPVKFELDKNNKNKNFSNKLKPLKKVKFLKDKNNGSLNLKPIKYDQKFSDFKSNEIRPIKYKQEKIIRKKDLNINDLQNLGKNTLENNKNLKLEFLWPIDTFNHDKIYKILSRCLESETVLTDNNNNIYNLNGRINRKTLYNNYSRIIRVPTYVHSKIEKNKINYIQNKFLKNSLGKHLRLYKKNVDAFIVGFYFDLAKRNKIEIDTIKRIRGKYNIINNQLFLEDLIINSSNFNEKILLSSIGNNCSI
ncbi:hypothetical protein OAK51_04105 [Alphaproteobacteria bacterium]|nr:hypothetical protein [Alphaproteobacteria bacterium]